MRALLPTSPWPPDRGVALVPVKSFDDGAAAWAELEASYGLHPVAGSGYAAAVGQSRSVSWLTQSVDLSEEGKAWSSRHKTR